MSSLPPFSKRFYDALNGLCIKNHIKRRDSCSIPAVYYALMILAANSSYAALSKDAPSPPKEPTFLESHAEFKGFLPPEAESKFAIGIGIKPIGVLKNKFFFGVSLFQAQWQSHYLDWQIIDVSIGFGQGSQTEANSRHFTIRTAPGFRLSRVFSVGVLGGIEFLNFQNQPAKILEPPPATTPKQSPPEPFSVSGLIYGFILSQTFPIGQDQRLRVNEVLYFQKYDTDKNSEGWLYNYNNADPTSSTRTEAPEFVKPVTAFQLEVSLLF